MSGNVGKVQILYSEFNSIFQQTPTLKTILPIETTHDERLLPYIFEPNIEELVKELLPYYLETVIYNSILESFTSEQAARMVAMQNAKNNALDIADYLTLSYNKSRQERITNELLALSSNL
jgi:F-type H+-transporting ATPase subunit gamma